MIAAVVNVVYVDLGLVIVLDRHLDEGAALIVVRHVIDSVEDAVDQRVDHGAATGRHRPSKRVPSRLHHQLLTIHNNMSVEIIPSIR